MVETKSIQELPLNGRMLLDLAVTVPGAHMSHGAQAGDMNPLYWRPGQRSAISIGGNRPNANYFLLDGVTNTDPTFNTQNISLSPDAVREFQVQTGSYSAEMGGAGGGQINIITRSGTSQFHGTAYEFLRNNAARRAHVQRDAGQQPPGAEQLRRSLGGPLYGKKTFFFANYEGLRLTQAMTMIDTVPTALEEAGGDFSQSGATIFDPASAHPNPNFDPAKPVWPKNPQDPARSVPGQHHSGQRLSPVAATLLERVRAAAQHDGRHGREHGHEHGVGIGGAMGTPSVFGAGMDSNNYMDVRNVQHEPDQGTVRVDRVFGDGDSLSAATRSAARAASCRRTCRASAPFTTTWRRTANVTWNRVISPNMSNTACVAVSRLTMDRYSENNAHATTSSPQLGIQGVGFGGPGAYGAPYFNVQGYSGSATPAWPRPCTRGTRSWKGAIR